MSYPPSPPYTSLPVATQSATSMECASRLCDACKNKLSYSAGYFICFICRIQKPNFPVAALDAEDE